MERSIQTMTRAITGVLHGLKPSVYLYGSATMEDFHPGWSDIDLLVLTQQSISTAQAEKLLTLRQTLPFEYPDIRYFRSFEGCMLSLGAFSKHHPAIVVYWGTSGQRITDRCPHDAFCLWQLQHSSRLLYGEDVRSLLPIPTISDLYSGVAQHLAAVLQHGRGSRSIYAFGWLLDIARGLYTLRYDAITSKTAAGEWALSENLCPDSEALSTALAVRRNPALMQQPEIIARAEALTPAISAFAAVLQHELASRNVPLYRI